MRLALALLVMTLSAASALASDVAFSPDSRFVLVQKNLGVQRWAIVRDQSDHSITGNIFNPEGGSQFVWCQSLGADQYDCVGNSGCTVAGCDWAEIATVTVPESFFSVSSETGPTPGPTVHPTPQPTPKPTPPPATGLSGLIGTWDITFTITSSFTFEYRLQRVQKASNANYQILVGLNEPGDTVVVARVQDAVPGSTLPYEFALAEKNAVLCIAYFFDQAGDRISGVNTNAPRLSNGDCGPFVGDNTMTGVRVSHSASVKSAASPQMVKRAINRHRRAIRAEIREAHQAEVAPGAAVLRELTNALNGGAAVEP